MMLAVKLEYRQNNEVDISQDTCNVVFHEATSPVISRETYLS